VAQQPDTTAPAALLLRAFEASQRRDGRALAALMHPEALAAYRDGWLGSILGWAEITKGGKNLPAGSGGFSIPDVTPELLARWARAPVRGFEGIRTLAELAALTPEELLVRVIALEERELVRGVTGRDSGQSAPRILGVVFEGDTLAHVLYRRERPWPGRAEWEPERITARRSGSRWLLMAQLGPSPALFHMFNDMRDGSR
jgi:hypothetical protein